MEFRGVRPATPSSFRTGTSPISPTYPKQPATVDSKALTNASWVDSVVSDPHTVAYCPTSDQQLPSNFRGHPVPNPTLADRFDVHFNVPLQSNPLHTCVPLHNANSDLYIPSQPTSPSLTIIL
ncbi:unnamed protein product [Dicrocoelium dendriticum]|nr:unnamed protein product [Dicrocoelium dendriticum]